MSIQENFDIAEFATNQREDHLEQPFLLCLKNGNGVPIGFYIIVDQNAIPCGNSSSKAFQVLFSCFFVFRVKYPPLVGSFFKYFEEAVFTIKKPMSPSNVAFTARLESMKDV